MRPFRNILLLFLVFLFIGTLRMVVQRRHPSTAMWIAFTQDDNTLRNGGAGQIYRISPTGKNLHLMSERTVWRNSPLEWSPDGKQIVYSTNECESGCNVIYMLDVRSRQPHSLTNAESGNAAGQWSPTWSADGEWLYYRSATRTTRNYSRMRPDGTQSTTLVTEITTAAISPDDTTLVTVTDPEVSNSRSLYLQALDGGRFTLLMKEISYYRDLTWSPNGQYVAFVVDYVSSTAILLIDIETGENQVLTTQFSGILSPPVWSPDSRFITVSGHQERGNADIYRIDIESGDVHQLMADSYFDTAPRWSSDGQWISFVIQDFDTDPMNTQLALMRPDGSERRVLSRTTNVISTPTWSPIIDMPFSPEILLGLCGLAFGLVMILPKRFR